ncbi:MAG: hypothetical protein H6742_20640 [Alphaproteobacteria bacterium]|nr:hypothetical protein [Alphaproteobacteria bacterium]
MTLLLPLMLACLGPDQGTVVGNPGDAAARVAPVSAELTLGEAEAYVSLIEVYSCEGQVTEIDLAPFTEGDEIEVDLLRDVIELPGGSWCALGLELDKLEFEGSGPDGSSFRVDLDPGWIEVEALGGFEVDGQSFVLEMAQPGWLSAELLGLEAGGAVTIDADAALHDALADTVALRSALFEDDDGDGELADDERSVGAVAAGEARDQDVADTGTTGFQETVSMDTRTGNCGRSQIRGAFVFLMLPGLLLGLRRR